METPTTAQPSTAPGVEIVSYPEFVDRQLNKVTRQLETGELLTGLIRWLSTTLFAILAAVFWDHWVSDLPFWSRMAISLGLITLSISQFVRHVVPPLRRHISPAFAAKMVESAEPGLKNGLINLIFLRKTPAHVNEVVLRELEQQTATRLTAIDVDSSVDRTLLVRWVAVLAMIVVLATAYTALAPKSLWQSVRRALNPWSTAARPSRVLLADIQPGDCTTYYGRSVTVSAQVSRLRDGESVWLVASSVDGQIVDQRTEMRHGKDGQFSALLPDDSQGATQDLLYRVEAGDANAGPFRVQVLEAPSAVIDKVRYEYPAYTELAPQESTEGGNLQALEGTRVNWWIRTNHEVAEAFLEWDPPTGPVPVPPQAGTRSPLQYDGRTATGDWVLQLRPDRQTPLHASYRIRFRNLDGQWNLEPVTHRVQVLPDLTPDVEILTPDTRDTQLPLNGALKIEVRGRDPDFALRQLELKGLHQGRDLLSETLLDEETSGQVIQSYELRPEQLGLSVGDMLFLWAEASDNRHDPISQKAAPNVSRTMDYRITIIEPDERQPGASDGDDGNQGDNGPPDQGSGDASDTETGENGRGDQAPADAANDPGNGPGSEGESSPDQQSQQPDAGGQQESQPQSSRGENGESPDAPAESGESQGNQEGSAEPGDESAAEQEGAEGAKDGSSSGSGTRQQGGEASSDTAQSDDTPGETDSRPDPSAGGDSRQSDQPSQGGERSGQEERTGRPPGPGGGGENSAEAPSDDRSASEGPLPSDGSRDGDAFERILEQMRRDAPTDDDPPPGKPSTQRPGANDGSEQAEPSDDAADVPRNEADGGRSSAEQTADASDREDGRRPSERPENDTSDNEGEATDREAPSDATTNQREDSTDDANSASSRGPTDGRVSDDPAANEQENGNTETTDRETGQQGAGQQGTDEQGTEQQGTGDGATGEQGTEGEAGSDGEPQESGRDGQQPGEGPRSAGGQRSEPTEQAARPDDRGAEPRDRSESPNRSPGSDTPPEGDEATSQDAGSPQGTDHGTDSPSDGPPTTGQTASDPGVNQGNGTDQQFAAGDEELFDQEDPANLDYAKQATELALEYLKDQEQNPDRELLERLGWSPDDLRRFVERWEQMRREANQSGTAGERARGKLDQLLSGLGLVPQEDRVDQRRLANERVEGVQEEGGRSEPPADYRDLYRAYLKSRQASPPTESP